MRTRLSLSLSLLLALGATACAADQSVRAEAGFADVAQAEPSAPPAASKAAVPTKLPFQLGSGGWDDRVVETAAEPASAGPERLLIQTGQVRVEVARPDEVIADFRAQVVAWGGHLAQQNDHTLVVRVPAARFEEAFQWVRERGRVLSEARQAQDVTEEYLDLGIRLDTARRSRERLLEVLQRAEKIEDVLKVEVELRRLTQEIERMEGRLKFLADQVALATLSATFESVAAPPTAPRKRRPSRFEWINRVGADRVMEEF